MVLNIKYCSYQLLRLIGVYVLNLDLLATYKLTQLFLIYISFGRVIYIDVTLWR